MLKEVFGRLREFLISIGTTAPRETLMIQEPGTPNQKPKYRRGEVSADAQ